MVTLSYYFTDTPHSFGMAVLQFLLFIEEVQIKSMFGGKLLKIVEIT